MFQKILKGYGNLFISILKILLLVCLCVACACILVLPLWKFAVTAPELYSTVVCILLLAFLVYSLVHRIKNYIFHGQLQEKERRKRLVTLIVSISKVMICLCGIGGIIAGVFIGIPVISVISFATMIVLYGILAFGAKRDEKKLS